MILIINTSDSQKAIVSLNHCEQTLLKKESAKQQSSQVLLPLIDQLLTNAHITLREIDEIRVHTGPGSYIGIRVGVSIAQTLALLLNISVNDQKSGNKISIVYENDHFVKVK